MRVRSHSYLLLDANCHPSPQDTIVLPGVGTFAQGIEYLRDSGLASLITTHSSSGGAVVGICLGMQMLLHASSESPNVEGLCLIPGVCERIPASPSFSVPHIGWNSLIFPQRLHRIFETFGESSGTSKSDYYFVHSYHAILECPDLVAAAFDHPFGPLTAAVAKDNTIGFQFHPEKSGSSGYALLDRVFNL